MTSIRVRKYRAYLLLVGSVCIIRTLYLSSRLHADDADETETVELHQPRRRGYKRKAQIVDHGARGVVDYAERQMIDTGYLDAIVPRAPIDAPGEMSQEVLLNPDTLAPAEREKYDTQYKSNGFNQYVSDMISVRRRLPDFRDKECLGKPYRDVSDLPDTSVVIVVYNEAWSALLRTVFSVLDNSPPVLIREIILVVDKADHEHLKQPLSDFMAKIPKVKVIHSETRLGLTRARLVGYRAAVGDVVTFLDSHCECTKGWLEPLLDRIADNRTNVVMPNIDAIHWTTFNMIAGDAKDTQVGGFDWSLTFQWHSPTKLERSTWRHPTDPLMSPTMAGGLFSIDRKFFNHIGGYDEGADGVYWGGENVEISFKIWMCGGRLEGITCSHVGHIFRNNAPYKYGPVHLNTRRVAEVWLGDYKKYYDETWDYGNVSYGDVSQIIRHKEEIGCKSFDWYLKNVYPEMFVPGNTYATGEIRNVMTDACIDLMEPSRDKSVYRMAIMYKCHKDIYQNIRVFSPQYWYLSAIGEIRDRKAECLDFAKEVGGVFLGPCHGQQGNQKFLYKEDGHIIHESGLCLEATKGRNLLVQQCKDEDAQRWIWKRQLPQHL